MKRIRLDQKRLRRHTRLAAVSALLLAVFFFGLMLSPELWVEVPRRKALSVEWRFSMSFAYTAVLFLSATLLIGPYYVLTGRPVPANSMLRRDVAIWAGVWAIAHAIIASFIHVDGLQFWRSFLYRLPTLADPFPLKFNRIGQANYIGLAQLSIIILLLLLSNNAALRRLGTTSWKNLQRLAYAAMGLMMIHAFVYHRIELRLWSFRWPVYAIFLTVIVVQAAGFFAYRRRQRRRRTRDVPERPADSLAPGEPTERGGLTP